MSAQIFYNNGSSSSEIITHLVNASDGAGLHFNGTDGTIDIASPPDLGTKFSFEFIIQADAWGSAIHYLLDFGSSGRFALLSSSDNSYKLGIYDGSHRSFGVSPLSDLKVHHLVVTVDDTAAILYDNGNQIATATIATPTLDLAADLKIGSKYDGNVATLFNGTFYRARFWNKTLSQTDVTSVYESASIDFADQWGAPAVGGANDKIEGDFTYNLDGWDAVNTWNTQTWDGTAKNMDLAANATGQNSRTANQLVPGYSYRVFYTASATAGAPAFAYHNGSALVAIPATGSGTSTISNGTQNTFDFVLPSTANNYFYIFSTTASDAVTIDDIHVIRTGCVSDYDLAFANPTQSTIIQDRAGVADGTAAGGVTQISPIEAVNTNKLNVGGTTPLVGIGVPPGSTPTVPLEVYGNIRAQVSDAGGFYLTNNTGVVRNNSTGVAVRTAGVDRLVVDTAGTVNINGPSQDLGRLMIADNAEATRSQLALISTVTTAAANVKADITFAIPVTAASANASGLCRIFGAKENASSGNVAGYLSFETRPAGGSLTESLRISSAGTVTATGDLGVGTTNPDAGTNAPTSRSSVGKLNTYTGVTAEIADSGTLDIPLTMAKGLMAYLVESNGNSNYMSAGFFRSNNNGASSSFTLFGQSENSVAVTIPSAGNIRITNNSGAAVTFFYAITVIAG